MIYNTNFIEHPNWYYKRVLRMRGALPNSDAEILLLGQVAPSRKSYNRKMPFRHNQKSTN
jgi:transposase-like protein